MYDLSRFIKAQEEEYSTALKEIQEGRKKTHWIWYIFPQIRGLGSSPMSEYYGIENIEEAEAYMGNRFLRTNLIRISQALLNLNCSDPRAVMGYPDDLKLRSSMTLFSKAAPEEPVFQQVLEKYYSGIPDERTLARIKKAE